MALVLADRVQETTTTSGTGTLSLLGAIPGYVTFGSAIGSGNTTFYCIYDQTAQVWEVGIGTVGSGTLSRDTVLSNSSGTTAKISLVGNSASVFCTYPSEKSVNLDSSGNVSPLGTISSGTWQGTTVGVAYGGTGVTSSSGANSVVLRDSDQNIFANSITQNLTKVTSTGGTTTLTTASSHFQVLTGTSTHTFKMPDATALAVGSAWVFDNDSTGNLFVTDYAGNPLDTVPPGGYSTLILEANGTVAGEWIRFGMIPSQVNWGTNSLDLGGSTVITNGTWNGNPIPYNYGGTTLTTFGGANNAIYSSSATALTYGTLPVLAGGTGATSLTANGVVYGSGTAAVGVTAAGATGQVLVGNTGSAPSWANVSSSLVSSFSAGTTGFTPNTATTGAVTLAGTLNVSNGGTGLTSLTAGRIPFGAGTSAFGNTDNLFWDNANTRLGIGTNTPQQALDIVGSYAISGNRIAARDTGASVTYLGAVNGADSVRIRTAGTDKAWFDTAGNLGLGVAPSAWGATWLAFQMPGSALMSQETGGFTNLLSNAFYNGTNYIYRTSATAATSYRQNAGAHAWFLAPSGTAGATISFTQAMTLDASGRLGIGTTSPARTLDVNGPVRIADGTVVEWGGVSCAINGSSSTNTMIFNTASTERMRITSAGNVGIGTSSPAYALDVNGVINNNNGAVFYRQTNTGSPSLGLILGTTAKASAPTGGQGSISIYSNDATNQLQGVMDLVTSATAGERRLRFGVVEQGVAFRNITFAESGGNVGIGTSSPTFKLEVNQVGAGIVHTDGTRTFATYLDSSGVWLGSRSNHNLQFYTNNGAVQLTLNTSGNLGLGVTPSAWGTLRGFDVSTSGGFFGHSAQAGLSNNAFFNGTNWIYKNTAAASFFRATVGSFEWHTAPSGTAGAAISFTQAMTLDASGRLFVGTTSGTSRLNLLSDSPIKLYNAAGNNESDIDFDGAQVLRIRSYHGSGSNLTFGTNPSGGANTERMRIDSSGNVGIGTSSPTYRLNLSGNANALRVEATNSATDVLASFAGRGVIGVDAPGVPNGRFILTDAGNVGIGISSPSGRLHVATTGAASNLFVTSDISTSALASRISLGNSTGAARFTIGLLGTAGESAYLGSEGNFPLTFQTNGTERMRVDTSGNLGLGTTSPNASGSSLAMTINGSASAAYEFRIAGNYQAAVAATAGALTNVFPFGGVWRVSQNGGSELARVDSSGNLLVGTTTAVSKVTVAGDISATFHINPTTISANYTVPANYNAMTAGPITINTGVTVTVSTGSSWVIV